MGPVALAVLRVLSETQTLPSAVQFFVLKDDATPSLVGAEIA